LETGVRLMELGTDDSHEYFSRMLVSAGLIIWGVGSIRRINRTRRISLLKFKTKMLIFSTKYYKMIELYTNNLLKFDFCDNKILGWWEIINIGVVTYSRFTLTQKSKLKLVWASWDHSLSRLLNTEEWNMDQI
jgi:hypothetical protein